MRNRWIALAIIFVSFLQLTLNWFAIVPAFGPLITTMHLGLPQIGLIVGAFIAGYGLAHIPAGLIAEAWGVRTALLLGIALETAGATLTAVAPDLRILLLARFICGVGGSIYIGSAIGLTTAWFRDHELVTATGLITGVAFALGAAIGLFAWGPLVEVVGWRSALGWGAAVGAITFLAMLVLFPRPPGKAGEQICGAHLDFAAMKRVFGDRDLWLLGVAFLGGYGAYFTTAQLLPDYAQTALHLSAQQSQFLGVIVLVAGIPGSFLGGWLADRLLSVTPIFLTACLVEGVTLLLIPKLSFGGLEIAAALIGGFGIFAFVGWISTPGLYRERLRIADVPTAAGLLFSIAAIGGVAVPALYSRIATHFGYSAGWRFMAVLCVATAFICLAARRPHQGGAVLNASALPQLADD